MNKLAEPLSIKILQTLKNMLDMYEYPNEEVLVLEAVANGIDAKAKKIEIKLHSDDSGHYVTFHNDGPPMNKADFENYHTISSSTKTKGEGIGFAGVGAKIYLAAWDKAEIITLTGKGNQVLVSKMFRRGDNVEYDSTTNDIPIKNIIGDKKIVYKTGTSYRVKVNAKGYEWLQKNIHEKLQFWFNYALISKTLDIKVNGITIKPWEPSGEKFFKKLSYKKKEIPCYVWISKDDIPEDRRHIVYSVYGKRIKNESVDWAYEIKGESHDKVFCLVDVSILANQLNTNKENFKKSIYTNHVKSLVKKAFYNELEKRGLIFKQRDFSEKTDVLTNELTKRLDKILQNPEFKFLNPFSNPRIHYVTVKDENGNSVIQEVPGQQYLKGTKTFDGTGMEEIASGEEEGTGYYETEKGKEPGKNITRKSKGVYIIPEDFPDDNREGWVDMNNRGIVYNTGHPFSKALENNPSLYDYNLTRVVITSLIKAKNEQTEMDAVTTFNYFEKILHDVWV